MKFLLLLLLCFSLDSRASFVFNYGLNYSNQSDSSDAGEFEATRTFHKVFLGASVDGKKTVFFGWNTNSWTSTVSHGTDESTYKMLEMGPRVIWFFNDTYHFYFTAEWNPYAKGPREKAATSRDISGSSYGAGLGYRFRLSRLVGLGASLNYHTLSIGEEKIGSTENSSSDGVKNIMPMLELSIKTR